jgi:ubiquinone/menaquinone biosynthesis C-methylase UbiE
MKNNGRENEFYCINSYYSNYDEEGRLLSKHGQVEYLTTMKYIEKYLRPGMKILEVGAATGRYSLSLADKGFDVTAVELIPHNLEILRSKIATNMKVISYQGNALNLSFLCNEAYDITLLLGPMYHLYNENDKISAMAEAIRVTKTGGLIFTAYCMSDATIFDYGFKRGNIFGLIEKKLIDTKTFVATSAPEYVFEIVRRRDIDALMSRFETKRLHYVATDLMTNHMRDAVDSMDDNTFDLYMKYHLSLCEREDITGITHHSLDIVKKLG